MIDHVTTRLIQPSCFIHTLCYYLHLKPSSCLNDLEGLFVFFQIEDRVASVVVAQLLYLQSEDAKKPINMYINSPGNVLCHSSLSFVSGLKYK